MLKSKIKIMRVVFSVIALVLVATLSAIAANEGLSLEDQMVVDKSKRSKVVDDYILSTRDAIQKAWTTPVDMKTDDPVKGRVAITYTVTRNGELTGLELIKGSGNEDMDRTLLEAIRKAAPYPPFPEEISARQMVIKAKFVVSDLPGTSIPPVDMGADNATQSSELGEQTASKKFKWGIPAGASQPKLISTPSEGDKPLPPPVRTYRWGVEP